MTLEELKTKLAQALKDKIDGYIGNWSTSPDDVRQLEDDLTATATAFTDEHFEVKSTLKLEVNPQNPTSLRLSGTVDIVPRAK